MKKLIYLFPLLLMGVNACQKPASSVEYNTKAGDPTFLYASSKQLTDVIIHDIFKPPVASRIYGYAYLAAYEAMIPGYSGYKPLMGQLNGSEPTPSPTKDEEYCFPVASLKAFLTVGRALTFSADMWDTYEASFWPKLAKLGIPKDVYERSLAYGELVAKHTLAYASKDHYKETRGFRYTVTNKPGTWVPTPPAYADACEPMWNTVRTFTLDSAAQFRCPPPATFDLNKNSKFWELTNEVYQIGQNLTNEQRDIAYFWDDNAFVTNVKGHVMFATKKMTPPGHWIAIATTIARQKKISMVKATELYALTAIALYDGFIACWDEKYRSARIRPETVINEHIDPKWRPFLETPAFPEYVSGHSAISAAAGQVINRVLGAPIAFVDSTEYPFGHGVRSFTSVEAAYQEASISRVYGGIHYRDGVEEGTHQGEHVGQWIVNKLLPATLAHK